MIGPPQWIVLAVALLRVVELIHARRNERRLREEGGVEHGARHHPLFVLLHGSWLTALFVLVPADAPLSPWLLGAFALLQLARLWVILSLGRFWTTRVITLPGVPLVRRGPYRWVRHPNYAIVALELAVLPLAFGTWQLAVVFSLLNAALLWLRIRVEDRALASRRADG